MSTTPTSWSEVPCENPAAAPSTRQYHTCALYNDCLYVFGGYGDRIWLNDFHEFSFSRKTWRAIPAAGVVPTPRSRHAAVVYKDSFYVLAGNTTNGFSNDLQEFNFLTQRWSDVAVRGGTPPTPRYCVSAVVYGSSMFCFGGYDGSCKNDMHEFNFDTGVWTPVRATGSVPESRYQASLVVIKDSCLLFGGDSGSGYLNDVHMFNFAQRTWSTLVPNGPTPNPRHGHIAVVHSNAMYVFGGYQSDSNGHDLHKLTLTSSESYAWENITLEVPSESQIYDHAAVVYNGNLVVFGGCNGSRKTNDFTQLRLGEDSTCPQSAIPESTHESTLISDLRRLVNNELMSDITFVVEDIPIHAHRNLCIRCDYFKSMFTGQMRESHEREVAINDVRHPIFLLFLEFLYTDEMGDVSVEDNMELLAVADRFGVDQLQRMSERRLQLALCVDNAATILYAADLYSATSLRAQCMTFLLNNFDAVSKTTAFADMIHKNPQLAVEVLQAR